MAKKPATGITGEIGGSGLAGGNDPTGGTTGTKSFSDTIKNIIELCGFASDSTMVKYIEQQQWHELVHVAMVEVESVKDFHT